MTLKEFFKDLKKELEEQLDYYDFTMTNACKNWVESVVSYYKNCISDEKQPLETCIEEILTVADEDESEERYAFEWPDDETATAIVKKALKYDTAHFIYITEDTGFSMTPEDCFKAEWYYSIREDLLRFMRDYISNKTS